MPSGYFVVHNSRSLIRHLVAEGESERFKCGRRFTSSACEGCRAYMAFCKVCSRNVDLDDGTLLSPTDVISTDED